MMERGRKAGSAATMYEEGMESKEEERVRGGSREEGDDRSGSLGSGRERVLSSRVDGAHRASRHCTRGEGEDGSSPLSLLLSLSFSLSGGNRRARVSRACSRCCFASERKREGEGS